MTDSEKIAAMKEVVKEHDYPPNTLNALIGILFDMDDDEDEE